MAKSAKKKSGRKLIGSVARAVFSTRMDPQLRVMLEKSAQKNSAGNVSQELEKMLYAQFRKRERDKKTRAIRALCFLIEQIALGANSVAGPAAKWVLDEEEYGEFLDRFGDQWRTDPFRFRAFEIAVAEILSRLRPPGQFVSPFMTFTENDRAVGAKLTADEISFLEKIFSSPENWGAAIAGSLWRQMHQSSGAAEERFVKSILEAGVSTKQRGRIAEAIKHELYGLRDARADLGLAVSQKESE